MRTGLIVYVVGTEPDNWDAASETMALKQKKKADMVEIITDRTGHYDVLDAWRTLLCRGMKRISCIIGEFSPGGNLTLKNRELHLCG